MTNVICHCCLHVCLIPDMLLMHLSKRQLSQFGKTKTAMQVLKQLQADSHCDSDI